MISKINENSLIDFLESDTDDTRSVIVQLRDVSPVIKVAKSVVLGRPFYHKRNGPPKMDFKKSIRSFKKELAQMGIEKIRTLDSIKYLILDSVTPTQIKRISKIPQVSRIRLNKSYAK